MGKKRLAHWHGVLLTAALMLGTVTAHADLTIKVQKGGEAPYLYAYTGSGDNATKYTGDWPGTQFTDIDGGFWTKTIEGVNTVNIILNMGSNEHQTADYLNLTGVNGVISLIYDGDATMFGTMPAYDFSASDIYFAAPPTWGTTYAIARNAGGGYEQKTMEEIGTDGMGLKILKTSFAWNDSPNTIEFHDNTTNTSGQLGYLAGGYYNTSKTVAQFMDLNASTFPDENFRNAIKASTGMSTDVITPSAITYLDVSNQGISDLTGIELFTNLETLLASNNTLQFANLENNKNLEVLDLSYNSALQTTFLNASEVTGNGRIYIRDCTGLTELYLNNCNFNAIGVVTLTALEKLVVSNNTGLDYVTSLSSCTKLEHFETANCGITAANDALGSSKFGALTKLKYLDASNNPNLDVVHLTNKSDLETLILNNNTSLQTATTTILPGLSSLANLKHVEFSGVDLSTNYFIGTATSEGRLTGSRASLEYLDISNDLCVTPDVHGYTVLKTLKIGGNANITALKVNNCTALETVDVTGNTAMKTLTMNNDNLSNNNMPTITGLSGCTSLTTLDLNNNLFTGVPSLDLPESCTSLYMNSNRLTGIAVPSGSPVEFLYAQNNGFSGGLELTAESVGSLKGLDLGNNGIISFKAENTALSALKLGDNPQMTSLELHGNANLTCTTASATMSDGSGLYLLGNTALETIDLSNSSFTQIGANAALQGLTAVETLNGSHNKFTTFTNSNYNNGERLASYVAGKASLEHLTGLKHLDLSYNELADSVHLFRNTLLEYLDVSHNNVIGPLAATEAEKLAMRLKKADLLRKYHCKETGVGISCAAATQATLDANEAVTHRAFDLRDIDLRDTTGLFHLDLNYNTELKYLDISDTNIHNTASGWWYMNPGWEYGTGGWYSTTTTNMPKSPANGCTRHHFVWLKTCGKLEEFHADNDNMQSLGLSTSPYLHTITAKGMYGDCYFMRDAGSSSNPNNLTERGNISISGSVATYSRTVYKTNEDGTLSGTVYYKDADGVEGGTNYYPNPVKWYDVSNSGYYAIRTANGVNLEHLDVSGNHLSELKVSGNTKLQYVDTENNDRLTYVDANDLPDLNTLKVADNPLLEKLYADNDPSLPGISGLDVCTALKYLHVQNDGLLGENNFNVLANTNLLSLLASSCNLSGNLAVSQCSGLDTLSVHNNQLTTLDVSSLQNMHWLNCYNNVGITELNVAASTGMTHLDLHNCSTIDLALDNNTALQYFDCDNNRIRELSFRNATAIDTIHANQNNLFQIDLGGNHSSLKELQFERNHINAIDLSGCTTLTANNIKDADNGRTITANVSHVTTTNADNTTTTRKLYYFQLDGNSAENGGGNFMSNEYCTEDLSDTQSDDGKRTVGRGVTTNTEHKTLAQDGLVLDNIAWDETPFVGTRNKTRAEDYGLVADRVIGTIVVLENLSSSDSEAYGTETYKYHNGISDSEFYLNWTANGEIITEVDDLAVQGQLVATGGVGCITVSAPHSMTITVCDLSGRMVTQRDIDAGQTVIDALQPGIYIVAGNKVVVN